MKPLRRIALILAVLTPSVILAVALVARSRLVAVADAPEELAVVTVEATFVEGDFLESVRAHPDGTLYVARLSPDGADGSFTWQRRPDGTTARLVGIGNNLAISPEGRRFVTTMSGTPEQPAFVLDEVVDELPRRRATFDTSALINGLVAIDESTLFAADSREGCIWRWQGGAPERWRSDPLFLPASLPGIPGLNGLRATPRGLLTVNSSTGQLLRVPYDGGAVEVLAEGLPGDGLAVGPDGSIFVATHPFNTIERIAPDGRRSRIGSARNGIAGPTDVEVLADGDVLVTEDGGAFVRLLPTPIQWLFPPVARGPARLLRLHIDAD